MRATSPVGAAVVAATAHAIADAPATGRAAARSRDRWSGCENKGELTGSRAHRTVPDDPRVAAYRGVRDGELLRSRGLFVAEGRHIVRRVVEDGRYRVRVRARERCSVARSRAGARDARRGACRSWSARAEGRSSAIAGYDVHRGCLALVHRPPPVSVDVLVAHASTLLVVLEGVSNADNVGGVFRNAAAFGAGGVLLSPTCCDPLYRKAIRTSMGATLRVPFARVGADDWPGVADSVTARPGSRSSR